MRLGLPFVAVLAACGGGPAATSDAVPAQSDAAAPDATPVPDPVVELQRLDGLCTGSGWCWRDPAPQGNSVNVAFATAQDDLWLAGERGLAIHWDGAAWRSHPLPEPPFPAAQNIGFVDGRGPDDLWAAANNLLYHWDGASWTLRDVILPGVDQQYSDVWIAPPPAEDVWVVMDYGLLRHAVGDGDFVDVPTSIFGQGFSIWGTSADDFWIVGRAGLLVHSDGQTFTKIETGTFRTLDEVWGASADDVWIAGHDGALMHWDGATWTTVDAGTQSNLSRIAGTSADDVWIVGGTGSVPHGAALHWDGATLTTYDQPFAVPVYGLAIADGRLWIPGADGTVYVMEELGQFEAVIHAPDSSFTAIWGHGDRDFWAVGPGRIRHWDGDGWDTAPIGVLGLSSVSGFVPVAGEVEVWAVGQAGHVHRLQGGVWTTETIAGGTWLEGVWTGAADEAIVVGDGGTIQRYAGGAWTSIASGVADDLFAVWGDAADRAWIVGAHGTILRWTTPDTITPIVSPTTEDLRAITGAGGKVWIATRGGVVEGTPDDLRFTAIPGALDLATVTARAADDVYVSGSIGQMFHGDGASWTELSTGVSATITGSFAVPEMPDAWIVTSSGGALQKL